MVRGLEVRFLRGAFSLLTALRRIGSLKVAIGNELDLLSVPF